MAKPRKKLTQYQKEVQNLKRRIKRAEKTGFVFDEVIIPRSAKAVKELRGISLYERAAYFSSPTYGEYTDISDALSAISAERSRQRKVRNRKPSPVSPDAPLQSDLTLEKLEKWISSFQPTAYKGIRGRNPRWERLQQHKIDTLEDIKELIDNALNNFVELYFDLPIETQESISVNQFSRNMLSKRIEESGVDIDSHTLNIEIASTEEQVDKSATPIIAAIVGRPLSPIESAKFENMSFTTDKTDYTNEDVYPY